MYQPCTHTRLIADVSGLSVSWRILGIGWTRRISASAIDRIELQIIGGGKRPLYNLKIHRRIGRGITAADGIRSKREAEWLRAALRQGLRAESRASA